MLDCFGNFCNSNGLVINPTKREMVVFGGSKAWKLHTWNVNGHPINRARQFNYLGVVLEGSRCIKSTITHRLECMARAQACSYRALKRLSIHRDPLLVADMFDIVARAAGEYGCEVWATPWLDNWHEGEYGCEVWATPWLDNWQDCPLQRSHISILKRCLGVKASTSSLAALFECGKYPMQVGWLVRCCKFWNKPLKALTSSSEMALWSGRCWPPLVHRVMQRPFLCVP